MNQAILIGRLGQKPEIKQVNNQSVCSVSFATSEKYNDKEGKRQESTDWHNLVFWGKTAELIEKYCDKGSLLRVSGKIKTRSYEDKDGVKRYVTDIVVSEIEFLGSSGGHQTEQQKQAQPTTTGAAQFDPNADYSQQPQNDGLPF